MSASSASPRPSRRPGLRAPRAAGRLRFHVHGPHPARARARVERGDDRARPGRGRGRVAGAAADPEELLALGLDARGPRRQPRRGARRRRLPDLGTAASRGSQTTPARPDRGRPARATCRDRGRARRAAGRVAHADAASPPRARRCSAPRLASGLRELFAEAFADRLHEPYRAGCAPLLGGRPRAPAGRARSARRSPARARP